MKLANSWPMKPGQANSWSHHNVMAKALAIAFPHAASCCVKCCEGARTGTARAAAVPRTTGFAGDIPFYAVFLYGLV